MCILGWNFRKLMPYWKSTFSNLLTCKVSSKNKKTFLNFGPKFLFQHQIFNQHPRICETIVSSKKKKVNLGPKMLCFSLWAVMSKIYCHICNEHPPICLIAKFRAKIRILQLGNKNASFRCFRQQFWKTIVTFEILLLKC